MPVQKLNRAIMYRAYPTPEQQVLLSKTFGVFALFGTIC